MPIAEDGTKVPKSFYKKKKKKGASALKQGTAALTNIYGEYRTGVQSDADAIARRLSAEESRSRSELGALTDKLDGPRNLFSEVAGLPSSQASLARTNILSSAGRDLQASRGRESGAKSGMTSMLTYLQRVGELQKQQAQLAAAARRSGGGGGGGGGGGRGMGFTPWQLYQMSQDAEKDKFYSDKALGEGYANAYEEYFGDENPYQGKIDRFQAFNLIGQEYGPEVAELVKRKVMTLNPIKQAPAPGSSSGGGSTFGPGKIRRHFLGLF